MFALRASLFCGASLSMLERPDAMMYVLPLSARLSPQGGFVNFFSPIQNRRLYLWTQNTSLKNRVSLVEQNRLTVIMVMAKVGHSRLTKLAGRQAAAVQCGWRASLEFPVSSPTLATIWASSRFAALLLPGCPYCLIIHCDSWISVTLTLQGTSSALAFDLSESLKKRLPCHST